MGWGSLGRMVGGVGRSIGRAGSTLGKVAPVVVGAAGGPIGIATTLAAFSARGGSSPKGGRAPYSQNAPLLSDNCPPGYHLVRRAYGRDHCVRSRRMNVTNPRALRRALRRARGFEKLAKRFIGFSSPKKPKGRSYFKKKSR